MNKEIEESRIHKKNKEIINARINVISNGLQADGYCFLIVALKPVEKISAVSVWGPTNMLAECVNIAVSSVTKMFSEEIRRQKKKMKESGLLDGETWEDMH